MSKDQVPRAVVHSNSPQLPHEVLTDLLSRSPYQEMWGQFMQRRRSPGISIRAVATFMAYELSDVAGREMSPEQYKDSVRRALNGDLITDRTVNRFISAFGFSPQEADELWRSVVYHRYLHAPASTSALERKKYESKRDYSSLSQTLYFKGDDTGAGVYFEVTETIVSEVDGLRYITPLFEGYNLKFDLLEGGTIEKVSAIHDRAVEHASNELLGPMIVTPYPLMKGDVHRLKTRVYVEDTYQEDGRIDNHFGIGSSEKPKFNVTIIVNFDAPPKDIRHCIWDNNGYDNPIIDEVLPQGRTHYSIHYSVIHTAFCGFSWKVDLERYQEKHGVIIPERSATKEEDQ